MLTVKVYERKGDAAEKRMFANAARSMLAELLTEEQLVGLTVKVKRVHCRNAMDKNNLGTAITSGYNRDNEFDSADIWDTPWHSANGAVARKYVTDAESYEGKATFTIHVRRKNVDGWRALDLKSQLETLAHELVHVAQMRSGRMSHLSAFTARDHGWQGSSIPMTVWEGVAKIEAEVVEAYKPCETSVPVWPTYWDQPWEIEARQFEKSLTANFVLECSEEDRLVVANAAADGHWDGKARNR